MSDYDLECDDCGVTAIEHVFWRDSEDRVVDPDDAMGRLLTKSVVAECPECHAQWTVGTGWD